MPWRVNWVKLSNNLLQIWHLGLADSFAVALSSWLCSFLWSSSLRRDENSLRQKGHCQTAKEEPLGLPLPRAPPRVIDPRAAVTLAALAGGVVRPRPLLALLDERPRKVPKYANITIKSMIKSAQHRLSTSWGCIGWPRFPWISLIKINHSRWNKVFRLSFID